MHKLACVASALLLLSALPSATPAASAPQGAGEPTILELGKPIERELRGGETHPYKIHVEAGQFVHVVVLQKGIDVAVTLRDPNGKQIVNSDSLNGSYGPEPVSAIAATSGDFRLEVVAGDAPAGRYEVQLATLRAPLQSDRTRMEAERVYMQGVDLFSQGNQQSMAAAADKWSQSFALWKSLNDTYGQALSLSCSGAALKLQAPDQALKFYNQAVPLWRAVADRDGEATTLNNIGMIYTTRGEERKALEYYTQALPLFRAAADGGGEATTVSNIAAVYDNLGDKQKALDYYAQALPLVRAAADRALEAATLNNIGAVYRDLGEKQKALDHYAQALLLRRAVGDRAGEAITLNNIGVVYGDLGEKQKALDYYAQALPLVRALGDRAGEAKTLSNIGLVYSALGQNRKALECFAQALPLLRAAGDRKGEARTQSNIAGVYDAMGEKQQALEYDEQALPLFRAVDDRAGEAITLNNVGLIYDDLGEHQKALQYFAQALPLFRAVGDRASEAIDLNNTGIAYEALGEHQKALDYFAQALPLSRAVGDRYGEASTLGQIGRVYATLGKKRMALDDFAQALRLHRAVGNRDGEAIVLSRIGQVEDELGQKQKALDDYGQALSLFQAVQDPLGEARALLNLMTYWKAQGRPSLAIFFGKQGVDRLQQVRRNIQGLPKEERQSFVKSNEDYYRDLADLLIQEGRLPEAQEVLDLLKLEEYAEYSHRRSGADSPFQPVTRTRSEQTAEQAGDPIQADLTGLGNQWLELKRKSSRTPQEQTQYDQLGQRLDAANQRWKQYLDGLYADFGKGDQANRSVQSIKEASSSLRNLLREMNPGTVALYTLVLDQKCVLFVITPAVMVAREAPVSKVALRSKVFAFVGALAGHQPEPDLLPKSQDLYRTLLAPVEKDLELAHAQTLLWSLDDVLRYVPLAALHDGKQYLAERFANVVITTTGLANLAPPQVAAWRGVAMGVSKNYDGLGELTAVPGELNAVVSSAAMQGSHGPIPGDILLDDAFTEKNLAAALEQPPPLLHMATHFVFNPGDDERSYLLLGGKNEGGKGYHLSLADLRNESRLNNFVGMELLTLSGCETGMGSKDSDGREVDSLGIVGQLNGAKSVVATLWKVDDASVGVLMESFYRFWITPPGMPKCEALRQAQLALLHGAAIPGAASASPTADQTAQYSNPYYWAPFVLMGNWK